ncbi:MAG: 4-hydroxy-3-methylbut-2-enyl diphosphate reductase [Verrucomicrobiales bacterium]|nr:4-hydroxy-3-methylbut-2-enyl diphosphate reductase [Verrucomicrobiales bacterium]|tara:strand:- start:5772 stop:6995 length:1224 start_codon:yes stop_codon:yes gene_type:complete
MSALAPARPKKVNLRRPDVMEKVQQQVEGHYRSSLVEIIRGQGNVFSAGGITIKLAKEFGFCYGVERAIDLAYAARKVFLEDTIWLLGEIIHNPEVNDQIQEMGIRTISQRPTQDELEKVKSQDVVIIPAFGTEVDTRAILEAKGCRMVDTTCGDVMSVWKRVRQNAKEEVTSIIHGKAWHEETMATSSQATARQGHYLVVYNLEETDYVCNYLIHGGNKEEFLEKFKGAYSLGFDPDVHLQAIGVANQTTMMRGETEEVQRRFKKAIAERYGEPKLHEHFRFFDTICGATQERQDALSKLLSEHLDMLIVVGGYNSSNTSHLAEMGEEKLPTYFIKNSRKMVSERVITHYKQHEKKEVETESWLAMEGDLTVGITAGASCPNNLIEDAIRRLFELRGICVDDHLSN